MIDPERDAAEALRVRALTMQLIEQHPFWGYLLLQMKVQYDRAVPAYGVTDGVHRVWLNPARTVALSTRELGFVLLHLLGHQLLAVTSRMRGRDPVLWGKASDYAVNRLIVDIAHPTEWGEPMYLPVEGALLSDAYDTLTVEVIYERLAARARPVVVDGGDGDTVVPRPDSNNESPEEGDGAGDAPTDDRGDSSASAPEWAGRLLPDHGGGVDVHLSETSMHEDTIREELLDRLEQAVALHQSQDSRGELPHGVERLVGAAVARAVVGSGAGVSSAAVGTATAWPTAGGVAGGVTETDVAAAASRVGALAAGAALKMPPMSPPVNWMIRRIARETRTTPVEMALVGPRRGPPKGSVARLDRGGRVRLVMAIYKPLNGGDGDRGALSARVGPSRTFGIGCGCASRAGCRAVRAAWRHVRGDPRGC